MVHWWILGTGFPIDTGKPAPKIQQWTIYFCRWGFGWVDKAQCFRSSRRFGAAGSSPDFSRGFSRHGAPRPLSWTFFQCTLLSYPGQPSYSHTEIFSVPKRGIFALPKFVRYQNKSGLQKKRKTPSHSPCFEQRKTAGAFLTPTRVLRRNSSLHLKGYLLFEND